MVICRCECGTGYSVARVSLGKKAKCQGCGAIFTLGPAGGAIPLAPAADDRDGAGTLESGAGAVVQGDLVAPPGSPAAMGSIGVSATSRAAAIAAGASYSRGFMSDVLWTFLFPSHVGNLAKYLVLWGAWVAASFAMILLCFGILALIVMVAWYAAFRFAVIRSAVAGEAELPDVIVGRDVVDGLILPFFKWVGSWAVVFLPAFTFLLATAEPGGVDFLALARIVGNGLAGLLTKASTDNLGFDILAYGGICMWPMVVLCITVGGFATLYRYDLMVATIARTLPVYVGLLALMVVAVYAERLAVDLATAGTTTTPPTPGFRGIIGGNYVSGTLRFGVSVYADIVIARLVGLYYHHFKDRFAWSWG